MMPTLAELEDRYDAQVARGPRTHRRIILHVGPHKTGTTFIQRMAESNACKMPLEYHVVPRRTLELEVVKTLIRRAQTKDDMIKAIPDIRTAAQTLGGLCAHADCGFISHEDILGAIPATRECVGLYPFHEIALRAVYDGLTHSGATVDCFVYRRPMPDWIRSHFRYVKNRALPPHFAARVYAERLGFPFNWDVVFKRLANALPAGRFHELSFNEERDTAFVGHGIYRAMGMTDDEIAALTVIDPQRVTDPASSKPT